MYKQEDFYKKVLEAVNEISSFLISSDFNLESVLSVTLKKAVEIAEGTYGQILLYDGYKLKIAASTNGENINHELSPSDCLCGEILTTKKLFNIPNVSNDKRFSRFFSDSVSELAVPMLQNGKILGIINIESSKENAFSENHERLAETLALQAAHAVKIAKIYSQGKILSDIKEAIVQNRKENEIYSKIIDGALKLINGKAGQFLIKRGESLIIAATTGNEKIMATYENIDSCISGLAVKSKAPVNIGDITKNEYKPLYKSYLGNIRSELSIPIIDDGEVIGVLNFEHPKTDFFEEEHIKLLQATANLAAIAMRDLKIAAKFRDGLSDIKALLKEMEEFPNKLSSALVNVRKITEFFEEKNEKAQNGLLPPAWYV